MGPAAPQGRVDGSLDELRAIAFLDIILNRDSRPATPRTDTGHSASGPGRDSHPSDSDPGGDGGPGDGDGGDGGFPPGPDGPDPAVPGDPGGSVIPAGFAGTINLTITAATLLGLADRPGEIAGIGPIDTVP